MLVVADAFTTSINGFCVIGISLVSVSGTDSLESAVTVFDKLPPKSISPWVTV